MKYILILSSVMLLGCNKHEDIELEIITKEINYLDIDFSNHMDYFLDNELAPQKSRTILLYKLTNHSNKSYYFNIDSYHNDLKYDFKMIDKAYVRIMNTKNEYQKPHVSIPSKDGFPTDEDMYKQYLNYNRYSANNYGLERLHSNFVIHPNETLYFEWFLILPFIDFIEDINYTYKLDTSQEYFADVLIHSDTIKWREILSRTDIKNIEENGYKIYNGTLESKNKIPIKFNKPD